MGLGTAIRLNCNRLVGFPRLQVEDLKPASIELL